MNTKLNLFNSPTHCVGTSGVDSFNYHWGYPSVNWLFPPPPLIVKTINHLSACKGIGLLLTPEWKSSQFYPFLIRKDLSRFVKKCHVFRGENCFVQGSDKSSHFGPNYRGRVLIWEFDFSLK